MTLIPAWNEDVWDASHKKISSIVSIIDENYFKEVDHEKLIYSSIKMMLKTLDPHSYFLDPKNFSTLMEDYKGKYYGLGIMIQKQEDRLVVISPIEGGPASRLGIHAGDIISHINGESTKPISGIEAMQKLRGPKGKPVTITIIREGIEKPLELTIVREEIPLYSVPYAFMLGKDIGYIFIRNFAETTTRELEEKMELLRKLGMKKLILDLRGNSGGTFAQSVEISDLFLPRGNLIVSIKGRNKYYNEKFSALKDKQYEKIPLIILINHGTASAPEIVSGAIKDNDRGLILGEDSWGKGVVQTVFPITQNTAVALTIARYFTPSGRCIQRDYTNVEDYVLNHEVSEEKREVRYTSKGRKVLGQGGISPDYEVKFAYKNLTARLLLKGAYFSYAREFANKETELSKKFIFPDEKPTHMAAAEKRKIINKNILIDNRFIDDFKSYLSIKNIEYDPEKFEEAKEEIRREIEREIFSSIWGIEEGVKTFRKSDPVVLKAVELFPEAESLIGYESL